MRLTPDDQGTYTLASVVCDPSCCDSVRETLMALRYPRQRRLHWRDEEGPRRTKIAAAVGRVDMAAVVVIGVPLVRAKQERARRICMETLLPALDRMGVSRVWLESRTQSLNAADRRMVVAMRGMQLISRGLQRPCSAW
jgi:hypothetical protein